MAIERVCERGCTEGKPDWERSACSSAPCSRQAGRAGDSKSPGPRASRIRVPPLVFVRTKRSTGLPRCASEALVWTRRPCRGPLSCARLSLVRRYSRRIPRRQVNGPGSNGRYESRRSRYDPALNRHPRLDAAFTAFLGALARKHRNAVDETRLEADRA